MERQVIKLDFNVTNKCNFRCKHCCFRSGEVNLKQLPFPMIQSILTEFKELGGKRIDITGGEATTRKDCFQIVALCKQLGFKTELVTNGSLLNEETLKRYQGIGLDGIAISLDGSNFKHYSQIRPVSEGTYKKVLKNIELAAKHGFYTKVNTVVFDSNLHDLIAITRLAVALGAREQGFYYFSPIGRGDCFTANIADPLKWIQVIRQLLIEFYNKIEISLETPIIESDFCRKIDTHCYMERPWHLQILPDGNVFPCAIMCAHQKPLANLYEQSLRQIWENEKQLQDYFERQTQPLFEAWGGCVNYPKMQKQIKSGKYSFVCLCKKFSLQELTK
ncbi:MAG: radical SAM protein [Candidatus Parcubacteria bacterium]|nr:radical SAM protein [Candidatus Parcubacteria bacterium]